MLMAGLCAFIVSVLAAPPAAAQVFTGRIDITIFDTTGARLPGVTVLVREPQEQVGFTDGSGQAHFVNLTIGSYVVTAELGAFQPYRNELVIVEAGAAVELRIQLEVRGVAAEVQVTAEAPIVDPRKQATGTTVSYDELQNIPSARDPWVVLQTIPGVIVDRVNVGGSESGQQSTFLGRGADDEQNTFSVDGIPITDMAATGSSSFYYDFDLFEEIKFGTGGSEITNQTSGVQGRRSHASARDHVGSARSDQAVQRRDHKSL